MNNVKMTTGAAGAVIGGIVSGANPAILGGALLGYLIGRSGERSLRRDSGTDIVITSKIRKEMESAMHIALAASWAFKPIVDAEKDQLKPVADYIFKNMVEGYTSEITPYVQEMHYHLIKVMISGIKPEDSLQYVRKNYGPKLIGGDKTTLGFMMTYILNIIEQVGATQEQKDWYFRWCNEVGVKDPQIGWDKTFYMDNDLPTIEEWKAARKQAAIDLYYED